MTVIPFPSMMPTPPSGLGTATGATADPAAAGFAALVASLVAGQFPAGTTTAPPDVTQPTEAAGQDGDAASEDEPSGDGAVVTVLPVPGLAAMIGLAPTAPAGASVLPAEAVGDATAAVAATGPTLAATVATTGDAATGEAATPATGTGSATEAAPATPESVSSTAPTGAAPAGTAAAPGTAAPLAATTPGTPAAADAGPVTRQVFPEITRLVSTGNGTHRVTLTLQPEQLGEVRVTLTVRDGEVVVRMAAGDEAQRALLEGAPELRRVLELTGATDTRIVVRDLAGTTGAHQPVTPAAGEGRDGSGLAGQAGDRTNDQHAGTRGGSTARDGSSQGAGDGPTGGATPPVPGRPVTGTRAAGLDVTI